MIKVLIADDHPIVRQGLKHILAEERDIFIAGEAATSAEVLNLIRKENWDVVVLDIAMPGRGGLEILKEIKQERPKLPVLILSMYPEDQYGARAFKAGASGYMTKEGVPEKLVEAIRKIIQGGRYVSPALAEKLILTLEENTSKPLHESLSDREYQVMCMIAQGKTLGEISQTLCLSVKTIGTYRSRIMEKMKMKSNAELIHYVISNRLID